MGENNIQVKLIKKGIIIGIILIFIGSSVADSSSYIFEDKYTLQYPKHLHINNRISFYT